MKFKIDTCWKHEDGMDAFIRIQSVDQDDGAEAKLQVQWMIQGTKTFWIAPVNVCKVEIKSEHYSKWHRFIPRHKE